MKSLKGTKTHENLKAAFAGESQANRRYLYFANKADIEGFNDVSAVFRSTAEGETGHAHGHPFPEGAGHARQVGLNGKRGRIGRPCIFESLEQSRSAFTSAARWVACSHSIVKKEKPMSAPTEGKREGSLQAPTRHPVDWQNPAFYDEEEQK